MQSKKLNFFVHLGFIIMVIAIVFPLIGMVMISFSNAEDVKTFGYSFIPKHFSADAYKMVFSDAVPLIKALLISLSTAVISPALTVILCASMGFAIGNPNFGYKKIANTYILIPMLFSGGLIPSYIINTQLFGLSDSYWAYIVMGLVSTWNIILFRTFFAGVPVSLLEAARIDGATEFQTLLKIIVPMSKPIIGSVFFTTALQKWNDYTVPLYYINNKDLYNIQYFLQNVIRNVQFINQTYKDNPMFAGKHLPEETLPFAVAVISCIPVMLLFPYIQKYFSKGMAVGAVKE